MDWEEAGIGSGSVRKAGSSFGDDVFLVSGSKYRHLLLTVAQRLRRRLVLSAVCHPDSNFESLVSWIQ